MLRCLAAFLALMLASNAGHAAAVNVIVTDAAGNPLQDAVVTLEPAAGHLAVKPLPGAEITQRERQFAPQVTVVTVGTPVLFPNQDTVRHHVYSFSPVKTFQLKLYGGVPHAPIVFDKPGIAVLGCNIHDAMVAWVVVVDTPLYARSSAAGRARVDAVPSGSYQLRVWHPGLAEAAGPSTQPLVVAAADIEQRVKLEVSSK